MHTTDTWQNRASRYLAPQSGMASPWFSDNLPESTLKHSLKLNFKVFPVIKWYHSRFREYVGLESKEQKQEQGMSKRILKMLIVITNSELIIFWTYYITYYTSE